LSLAVDAAAALTASLIFLLIAVVTRAGLTAASLIFLLIAVVTLEGLTAGFPLTLVFVVTALALGRAPLRLLVADAPPTPSALIAMPGFVRVIV
jgi:hypothetical protein